MINTIPAFTLPPDSISLLNGVDMSDGISVALLIGFVGQLLWYIRGQIENTSKEQKGGFDNERKLYEARIDELKEQNNKLEESKEQINSELIRFIKSINYVPKRKINDDESHSK